MVVLFRSELSCSTIFWDLTNTFKIFTITVIYLILAEYVIFIMEWNPVWIRIDICPCKYKPQDINWIHCPKYIM